METEKEVAVDEVKREFANYAFVMERPSDSDTPVAGVIQFKNQTDGSCVRRPIKSSCSWNRNCT